MIEKIIYLTISIGYNVKEVKNMKYTFDAQSTTQPNDNYWQFCIGSCHAATALRESYRKQLTMLKRDIDFKYIRFHGLFDDDMCVIRKSLTGEYVYSFTLIDDIFDFLLSIGIKPFVEIGFMPECLASGNEHIFHYNANITPPKDDDMWTLLVEKFVTHLVERYGLAEVRQWFFEIWNEPNLGKETGFRGGRFWSGDMDDYYHLYTITVNAIKKVDNRLRVGGPATSNNALIPQMLHYCKTSGTPIDFVTTHHYPTDVVLGYGVEDSQNFITAFNNETRKDKLYDIIKEYITFQSDTWSKVDRGVLTDMAKRAKQESQGLPLYYTEWSSLAGLDSDGAFGASFILKTIQDNMGIVDGYSYWAFTDIFEEKGVPNCAFHGGFGLITIDGIKKAPYNAFLLLSKLGAERYVDIYSKGTVDVYCFKNSDNGTLQILAVNHQSLLHSVSVQQLDITVANADILDKADMIVLDNEHGNAVAEWQNMGCPQQLTQAQILHLMSASELTTQSIDIKDNQLTVKIEPQGAVLITMYQR